MRIQNFLSIFILVSVFSCKNPNSKLQDIANFDQTRLNNVEALVKVNHDQNPTSRLAILLQNGFCGACTEEVLKYISEELAKNKIIIIYRNVEPENVLNLASNKNFSFVPLESHSYEKMGLVTGEDCIFILNDSGKVIEWEVVNKDNFAKISKRTSKGFQ